MLNPSTRMTPTTTSPLSRFLTFERDAWARLRDNTPLTLSEGDLDALRGLNEQLSLDEVAEIYLPLSRLLNLHVRAVQGLYHASQTFLGNDAEKVPFIIGLAGSVAVGKSTTARVLQALLSRWPSHPSVALVTTDGFLFSNGVLSSQASCTARASPRATTARGWCASWRT
jgi:type I pantothenate kinase